jgi:hypothetical protein
MLYLNVIIIIIIIIIIIHGAEPFLTSWQSLN